MDALDGRLMTLRRHDGRRSVSDLAADLGVSRATVRARMDRLRQAGDIVGYTIILPTDATDMPVRCIMMVAIAGHVTDKVVKALGGFPEVSAVHTTNGRWDLVVELGTTTLPALDAVAARYPGRLTVVEGDALDLLPGCLPLRPGGSDPWRIVANLPYNIATVLLTRWLESEDWPAWFGRMTLMFQREVAERIVAGPPERADYGRLGVLCGWRTRARILFDVAPSAFVPPPKVVSTVVELEPRLAPLPCSAAALSRVTAAAFGQRRKMLRQSLKSLCPDVAGLLDRAGLDGRSRAETLEIADFVRLAGLLEAPR